MSEAAGPAIIPPTDRPAGRRRWIPFWLLQAMELVVAFVFVDISVHVGNSGLMVAAALAFALLAVTARGPLGIVRICRPWLHLTLVVSLAVVVALAPIFPAARPDIEGIIVVEFGAIGLIRLATLTDMNPSSRRSVSRRPDRSVIEATATVSESVTPPTAAAEPARNPAPSTTGAAARWAGRAAGVVSASGRQTVARHRPEAEHQVKRAIRGAGRLTGRVTSPAEPHRTPDAAGSAGDPTGD
jgi:hypothetical protein